VVTKRFLKILISIHFILQIIFQPLIRIYSFALGMAPTRQVANLQQRLSVALAFKIGSTPETLKNKSVQIA
jgi:hypothetical protein